MFSHWPIRNKLQLGLGLLAISVLTLFGSAYYGLYAYRGLLRGLSCRSPELPLANELSKHAADLRVILSRVEERFLPGSVTALDSAPDQKDWGADFALRQTYTIQLQQFCQTLKQYREQLDANTLRDDLGIGDDHAERKTLQKIDETLARVQEDDRDEDDADWILNSETRVTQLRDDVEALRALAAELPKSLIDRLHLLQNEVRTQYRVAITLAWGTAIIASLLIIAAVQMFRKWIAGPLATLVEGSRKVAAGKFDHRIRLESDDEMRELAESMNAMTARFQEIRDDLDQQVRERTKQVVRSEQLASVGFLAAGVAHEINNPLASIVLCSESLESRLSELLEEVDDSRSADRDIVRSYLEMIQKEAFRCKQITEKLLDFSRSGEPERNNTDLRDLVAGVIEMVRHLGRYDRMNVVLTEGNPVIAEVCPQEMKQVVLNLITNALDSLESGGTVTVDVSMRGASAEIVVVDNGCGMTEEVARHLFEPFFTRRRNGQGTGLGLSITYRIVEEHNGQIVATSAGVGKGSRFTVTVPLRQTSNQRQRTQAA